MKFKTMVLVSGVLASALLVSACGSGSGGVTSTPSAAAAPAAAPASAGGAIGGVAAKGLLSNAIVTAYCGNSEAAADMLATGTTDVAGNYSLTWTTTCTLPLKLVVTANASTTMADEATGANVTPPAGFKLRALVADPDVTTTKNITPFTDMAVAVAGTSPALSKTAASNAESAIITSVLGGDISTYLATPVAPTTAALANASADQKKLATLLTVISAFAEDSTTTAACGKLTTGTGAKIQCALDAFSKQAAATVTSVSDAGYTVATTLPTDTPSTMLSTTLTKITTAASTGTTTGTTTTLITATGTNAVSTVVTADTSGSSALLTSATSTVKTASTTTSGSVAVATATPLQAARDLFNSLKTDLLALSNGSGTGYLDQKLSAMQADFTGTASTSATASAKSIEALTRAISFAHDSKTATWSVPGATLIANAIYPVSGSDVALETDGTGARLRFVRSHNDGMNCYVQYSDFTSHLGKAGCYFSNGKANVPLTSTTFTGFYEAVEVAESATVSGTYTWQDFMASRNYSTSFRSFPAGSYLINGNGRNIFITSQVATNTAQTGTAVVTWNSNADVTAATIKGNIQPLVSGQDYSTLDITGLNTLTSGTSKVSTITGTVTNVKGTATTMTMSILSGSQVVQSIASATTIDHPISGKFIVQLKSAAFQYDGTVAADTFTKDLSPHNDYMAANGSFTGKISTLTNGTATEFLSGTLGLTLANVAGFDPTQPDTATNYTKPTGTFSGKVTNGSTTYDLTMIVDGTTFNAPVATLNYSRSASQLVSVTIAASAINTANPSSTVTINGSGNVNAVITNGIGTVNTGTTKVGTVTKNPSQVTFTDGTYLLLGI